MLSFYCAGAMYCAPTVSTFLTHPPTIIRHYDTPPSDKHNLGRFIVYIRYFYMIYIGYKR